MVPLEKGKKMASKIKNSELSVIKECGHMILFEKAFEMREIVKKFIEKNHQFTYYEKILYSKVQKVKKHSFY